MVTIDWRVLVLLLLMAISGTLWIGMTLTLRHYQLKHGIDCRHL